MKTQPTPPPEVLGSPSGSLAELRAEAAEVLRKIRADKQPTRRGILLCGEMMGKMLKLGWDKDDLDSFELMFWITRDADGRMLPRPENAGVLARGENATPITPNPQ
jgi:hypothetical protein